MEYSEIKKIANGILKTIGYSPIRAIREDIHQEAYIGYLKAKSSYKANMGATEASWIRTQIYYAVMEFLHKEIPSKRIMKDGKRVREYYTLNNNIVELEDIDITTDSILIDHNSDIAKQLEDIDYISYQLVLSHILCNIKITKIRKELYDTDII